jgi:hypothetical protein
MNRACFAAFGLFVVFFLACLPDAMAACGGQIAGPVSAQPQYFYSSTCFNLADKQVRLRHQVCSVSPKTLMFKWTKLNWVSGASGVEYGGCLVRASNTSGVQRLAGSLIATNVGQDSSTDVYLPDLKDGNKIYSESIDGGGSRVADGDKEPFHFDILYAPGKKDKTIEIRARMSGNKPVFFLVLPRSIKNQDDLKQFIPDEYLKQIAPLVTFGSKPLEAKLRPTDTFLAQFLKENEVAGRGSIMVQGETQQAAVQFAAFGELEGILPQMLICLGQAESMSTCFQAGPVLQ